MVFLVILILCFLLQLVLPWWVIIIISFATCGLISKTGKIALWSPFFAVSLLWISMALLKSLPNSNIIANRVAGMFSLPYWWLVLLITVLLAGFAAGISGFCGYHFRKAVLVKRSKH